MTKIQLKVAKWSTAIVASVIVEIFLLMHFWGPSSQPKAIKTVEPSSNEQVDDNGSSSSVTPEINSSNDSGIGDNAFVVDSDMSPREALSNQKAANDQTAHMAVVDVAYLGFDGQNHKGQIVVNKDVASDVGRIFDELLRVHFPIEKVVPIVKYDWNDQDSIDDNNTSGFNYRHVIGPGQDTNALSHHSYGRAIDLNPKTNPFVAADGSSARPYDRSGVTQGTITKDSDVVKIFKKYGWSWGGNWAGAKDYQHFEKLTGLPPQPTTPNPNRTIGHTTPSAPGPKHGPSGTTKPDHDKKPGDKQKQDNHGKSTDPIQLRGDDANKGGDKNENSVTISNGSPNKNDANKGDGKKGAGDKTKGDEKKGTDPPPDKGKTTGGEGKGR